ncbi:endoglycosylceramidase, partial [Streptomyces tricolor]
MTNIRVRLLAVLVVLSGSLTVAGVPPATAATPPDSLWFDGAPLTVRDGRFTDGRGREIVLRGYNVSGETKLEENGGLPFASAADARRSATA